MTFKTFLKQWRFTLILIGSVILGALIGCLANTNVEFLKLKPLSEAIRYVAGPEAERLKPLGDVLLNLLFTAVVPLVFFSMASAVAASTNLKRLGRIAGLMLVVFVITGILSSILMIGAIKIFDPAKDMPLELKTLEQAEDVSLTEKIVQTFTVSDFKDLLSRRNMLALIVFSILTGLASQAAGDKGEPFRKFLISGSHVMGHLIKLIMLYAPIGLAGYFASLVGTYGTDLLGAYGRAAAVYYPVAGLYFVVGFSVYALIAAGSSGLKRFWTHIPPAALTAWGTGSSLAALPMNFQAAERIGVPEDVREIVLPLGATIHMDGSCLAAIMKIAVLFSLFGREFTGLDTYASAIGIALLCGIVMSGIPGGGFLGEMLIVTLYGFDPAALPIIVTLGILVDPPATMINASGDTVAAMLIGRLIRPKTKT